MGPVSAISVLILGIVVPALAGYIEVSQTTFPIFSRARLNLQQHEVRRGLFWPGIALYAQLLLYVNPADETRISSLCTVKSPNEYYN